MKIDTPRSSKSFISSPHDEETLSNESHYYKLNDSCQKKPIQTRIMEVSIMEWQFIIIHFYLLILMTISFIIHRILISCFEIPVKAAKTLIMIVIIIILILMPQVLKISNVLVHPKPNCSFVTLIIMWSREI